MKKRLLKLITWAMRELNYRQSNEIESHISEFLKRLESSHPSVPIYLTMCVFSKFGKTKPKTFKYFSSNSSCQDQEP